MFMQTPATLRPAPNAPTAPEAPAAPQATAAPPAPGELTFTVIGPDGAKHIVSVPQTAIVTGAELPPPSPPGVEDEIGPGIAIGAVSTLFLVWLVRWYARRSVRKAGGPLRSQLQSDSTERLERLERGVEAIAIEIERISEGQRFVTKIMADQNTEAKRIERT
jgi:hypothetical protein